MTTWGKQVRRHEINVLAVIDTTGVKQAHGPNEDRSSPVPIDCGPQFLICTSSRGIVHGQGTGELKLRAKAGDRIAVRVLSTGANSDDAVLPYDVRPASGRRVLDRFEPVFDVRERAVWPDPDSADRNGLPPIEGEARFLHFDSTIKGRGIERLEIAFVLFALSSNGQRQDVFGYYIWGPMIIVV
ncbi:inclusion body family protein [Burkholderia sp. AU30280]|uniref:AidA/PixA family protein n=1 Tax=Burkholderia sp. AU30280 TaxID=2879628 RepID=UPI001CF5867B|nr:AidA/PixA family protein [Burkholderia sp. AU30280]MCA8271032.1 inclusion body family protein [Burkholderia sp. AU30280]